MEMEQNCSKLFSYYENKTFDPSPSDDDDDDDGHYHHHDRLDQNGQGQDGEGDGQQSSSLASSSLNNNKFASNNNINFEFNDDNDDDHYHHHHHISDENGNNHQNSKRKILLAWKNLRYEVDDWQLWLSSKLKTLSFSKQKQSEQLEQKQNNSNNFKRRKIILKRLNGFIEQNSLNALLGPSGAGKTSLIKCLTGNVSKNNLSNDTEIYLNRCLFNKNPKSNDPSSSSLLVGFVPQLVHEIMFENFTVEEILYYAFRFKNPYSKRNLAYKHICSIIDELMLDQRCLPTKFKLCSGGEQRRVAIAQELMSIDSKPSFLFVDEPTTGLDSEAALLVMRCLRRLSQNNPIAIIVSIHAPSSDILNLFDQLYVMAKGGICIYSGSPDRMRLHLKNVLNLQLEKDQSPIEEYLRIASNGINDEQVIKLADDTLKNQHGKFFKNYSNNKNQQEEEQRQQQEQEVEELLYQSNGMPHKTKSFCLNDFYLQFYRLFRLIFFIDNHIFLGILLVNAIFITLVALLSNSDMIIPNGCTTYDPQSIQILNRTCQMELNDSLLTGTYIIYQLIIVMLLIATALGFSAVLLIDPLKVFNNEHQNGWYSLGAFFWSFQLVYFIQISLISLNSTIVSYLTAGYISIDQYQLNWKRFGNFYFFNWLLMIYLQSHGHVWGVIFMPNIQIMTLFTQLVFANLNILNGLSVSLEIMNSPMVVELSKLIGVRFLVEGLLYSFYGIDRCDPETEYSYILKRYYIDTENIYKNILPALINILALRLTTLILMYLRFSFNRNNSSILWFKKNNIGNNKNNNDNIIINNNGDNIKINYNKKSMRHRITSEPIPIDYDDDNEKISIKIDINEVNNDNIDDDKSLEQKGPEQEMVNNLKNHQNNQNDNEEFFKNRYIIGWRDLNLFAKSSIYELRSLPNSAENDNYRYKNLILKNLNGQLKFGTINALMGTSGSGKTSLLKILNGRKKTKLTDTTKFYLSKFVPIKTCFITQEISGHLLPGLTSKQSLIYASKFKNYDYDNYQNVSDDNNKKIIAINHEKRSLKLLKELDLLDIENTMVQFCSDGQRKRLALALELTSIRMPNLVCIDEPTSGLDSNSSRLVIYCLKKLVRIYKDITIVASIHQPNTELLMMFDQCYVLSRDGLCIYSGPPSNIKSYLNQLTNELSSSEEENEKENVETEESTTRFPIETLIKYSCTDYDNKIVKKMISETELQIKSFNNELEMDTVYLSDGIQHKRNRFSFYSVWILIQRYLNYLLKYQWKEWIVFISIYTLIGLSLIFIYDRSIAEPSGCLNLEEDFYSSCTNKSDGQLLTEARITNNINYISYTMTIFCQAMAMQTLFSFTNELKYFLNEHRNGWYSSGAFYFLKFIFETITSIPIVMIYIYIVNIYDDITPNPFYKWQVLNLTLSVMSFHAISHIVVLITNGQFILMILTIASFLTIFLMLSNLFNPISQLSYIFQMISNFSIFRWLNESTLWLVYGGDRCASNEIQSILYQFMIPNTIENFFYSIFNLILLVPFYHLIALALLIYKYNPMINRRERVERIEKYRLERLLSNSKSTTKNQRKRQQPNQQQEIPEQPQDNNNQYIEINI